MAKNTFKVSQVRDLLNQVYNEKITFSKFVEILNKHIEEGESLNINPLDNSSRWWRWLKKSKYHGLTNEELSEAIREIYPKINEIITVLNNKK